MSELDLLQQFKEKAEAVSAIVLHCPSLDQAFEHTLKACLKKQACQILASGCELPLSSPSKDLCELKEWQKLIAAPGLRENELQRLKELCQPESIALIHQGLNQHLGGIDIGLTWADWGIAATGTLVMNVNSEDKRLAGMISELHINLLPESKIVPDSYDLLQTLEKNFSQPPDYTAFITGASRTADIERVLTLGVHGPLEVHILILEGY